jgi:hypothetical protein
MQKKRKFRKSRQQLTASDCNHRLWGERPAFQWPVPACAFCRKQMAVRERSQTLNKEAQTVLDNLIQANSLKTLKLSEKSISTFLTPLHDISITSSQKQSTAALKSLTTKFGAFLIEVLKETTNGLSRPSDSESLQVYVNIISKSLDSLHLIRSTLKGRHFEVEIQRYAFLRKLVVLHRHDDALGHAHCILQCVSTSWGLSQKPSQGTLETPALPAPGNSQPPEAVALVSGTVIHLLVCMVEHSCTEVASRDSLQLASLLESLPPWLR